MIVAQGVVVVVIVLGNCREWARQTTAVVKFGSFTTMSSLVERDVGLKWSTWTAIGLLVSKEDFFDCGWALFGRRDAKAGGRISV